MAPPNQTGPWDTVAGSTSSEWETLIGCTDGSNPTIMGWRPRPEEKSKVAHLTSYFSSAAGCPCSQLLVLSFVLCLPL